MARYIDADAVIYEVMDAKQNYKGSPEDVAFHNLMCDNVFSWVDGAVTVDAVKVVRCKDCRRASTRDWDTPRGKVYCKQHCVYMKDSDYCNYGDRK